MTQLQCHRNLLTYAHASQGLQMQECKKRYVLIGQHDHGAI